MPDFSRLTLPELFRRASEWRGTAPLTYLGLALGFTWPLALHPTSSYAGGPRTDAMNAIWSLWFAHDAIAEDRLPLQTHLLNHPMGGRLVVADLLNAFLGFPLVALVGAVGAYAILVIFHLWFAGWMAHRLGTRLGGNGWVAGIGYQSSALILSHLQNGSSEAVAAGWLPFGIFLLVEAIEKGGLRRIFFGGIGLFLAALGSGWYAGVGAFLFAGSLLLFGWQELSRKVLYSRLIPALFLGLALTGPLAAGTKSVAVAEDGLVEIKNDEDVGRIRRTLGAADPRVFFVPGNFASPDFANLEGNPSDRFHTAYLGYVLLGLALFRMRRGDQAMWFCLILGLLLAMGPVVVINGFPVSLHGKALPLPYSLLEKFPGFGSLSLLYRLASISVLLLALLADRAPGRWALLVLAEALLLSPARHLPQISTVPSLPAAEILATLPPGAVMNVPIVPGHNFLYEQILHHKPVVGSLNTSVNRPGLQILTAARKLRLQKGTKEELISIAKESDIRYLVQHKNVLAPEAFLTATVAISQNFPNVAEDPKLVVYQLW